MSTIFPGPCIKCGAKNYPLSIAGEAYCPQCSALAEGEQKAADLEAWKHWSMGTGTGIERPTKPFEDKRKHLGMLDDWPSR
jgi:hypothetical protein